MARPRSIILLIIWFMWAAGKDLESLARFSVTSDYYIFSSHGLSILFFLTAGAVFLLNAASAWYLFKPEPIGYPVLLTALAAGVVFTVTSGFLAVRDLDGVRNAYEIGRELRGLPVREEALNAIFTPKAIWTGIGLTVLVYAVVAGLVIRNKSFFLGPDDFATEA